MRVQDLTGNALVLERRTNHGIHHQDDDIGLLDRRFGTEEREVVDGRLGHLRMRLHAGGIDEHVATGLRP